MSNRKVYTHERGKHCCLSLSILSLSRRSRPECDLPRRIPPPAICITSIISIFLYLIFIDISPGAQGPNVTFHGVSHLLRYMEYQYCYAYVKYLYYYILKLILIYICITSIMSIFFIFNIYRYISRPSRPECDLPRRIPPPAMLILVRDQIPKHVIVHMPRLGRWDWH